MYNATTYILTQSAYVIILYGIASALLKSIEFANQPAHRATPAHPSFFFNRVFKRNLRRWMPWIIVLYVFILFVVTYGQPISFSSPEILALIGAIISIAASILIGAVLVCFLAPVSRKGWVLAIFAFLLSFLIDPFQLTITGAVLSRMFNWIELDPSHDDFEMYLLLHSTIFAALGLSTFVAYVEIVRRNIPISWFRADAGDGEHFALWNSYLRMRKGTFLHLLLVSGLTVIGVLLGEPRYWFNRPFENLPASLLMAPSTIIASFFDVIGPLAYDIGIGHQLTDVYFLSTGIWCYFAFLFFPARRFFNMAPGPRRNDYKVLQIIFLAAHFGIWCILFVAER